MTRDPSTHPSGKPKDSLQVRRGEDVSAHHSALEAGGVGLDAVKYWAPDSKGADGVGGRRGIRVVQLDKSTKTHETIHLK